MIAQIVSRKIVIKKSYILRFLSHSSVVFVIYILAGCAGFVCDSYITWSWYYYGNVFIIIYDLIANFECCMGLQYVSSVYASKRTAKKSIRTLPSAILPL